MRRQLDAVHVYAVSRQGQGDAPGPDGELEGRTVCCIPCQERGGRLLITAEIVVIVLRHVWSVTGLGVETIH